VNKLTLFSTINNLTAIGLFTNLPGKDSVLPLSEEPLPRGWHNDIRDVVPSNPFDIDEGLIAVIFALVTEAKKSWNAVEARVEFQSVESEPPITIYFAGSTRQGQPTYQVKSVMWTLADIFFYSVGKAYYHPLSWRTRTGTSVLGLGNMYQGTFPHGLSCGLTGSSKNTEETLNVTDTQSKNVSGATPQNDLGSVYLDWRGDGEKYLKVSDVLTTLVKPLIIVGEFESDDYFPAESFSNYNPAESFTWGITSRAPPFSHLPTPENRSLRNNVIIDVIGALAGYAYENPREISTGIGAIIQDGTIVGSIVLIKGRMPPTANDFAVSV